MKVIHGIENYQPTGPAVLTMGTFDGVHLGHQKILSKVIHMAKAQNALSVVLTFFPHPRTVLQGTESVALLDTIEEKTAHLDRLGIDVLIIHKFTKAFSRLTAVEFARDILHKQLQISNMVIGYDHRFGQNREATVKDLVEFGTLYEFKVDVIPPQDVAAITVSSTKIRNALNSGDIATVNNYLKRPYLITGSVVKGDQLGRTIGFPTANLQLNASYKMWPANGVYWIRSTWEEKTYFGMMNIGKRPTVTDGATTIEVHFFNFNADLYGALLQVELLAKIRDEKKFDSLEMLQQQLEEDKAQCEKLQHQQGGNKMQQ